MINNLFRLVPILTPAIQGNTIDHELLQKRRNIVQNIALASLALLVATYTSYLFRFSDFSFTACVAFSCIGLAGAIIPKIDQRLSNRISEAQSLRIIENNLREWKLNPEIQGYKAEAAWRIIKAFKNKSASLDLRVFRLTALPDALGSLTRLTELSLQLNQLMTLPDALSSLTSLTQLSLESNQLTTLPDYFSTLTSLISLSLDNNQLKDLPNCIASFSRLESLYLQHNQLEILQAPLFCSLSNLNNLDISENRLTTLPDSLFDSLPVLRWLRLHNNQLRALPTSIGNCRQLENLYIHNNRTLRELPMSLGQIPGLTYIDIEGTSIPPEIRQTIGEMTQAIRRSQETQMLPLRLQTWSTYAAMPTALFDPITAFNSGFNNEEKCTINEWLTRLERTTDFSSDQQGLSKIVCELLLDTIKNSDFKKLCIDQMAANNACCEDRAAMALNELYVSWCLLCPKAELSLQEQLTLLQRAGKTLALREILTKTIQQHSHGAEHESVEIYLYYEIALRDKLDLLTAIQSMRYGRIGKRDWINEQKLIDEVEKTYLNHVVELPIFNQFMERDAQAIRSLQNAKEPFQKQMEDLGECPAGDDISEPVLQWHTRMGECGKNCEQAVVEAKKQWLQDNLRS